MSPQKFHGYLMFAIITVALVANVISIYIFSLDHMGHSTANQMFLVLAVFHGILYSSMIPYHIYDYILDIPCKSFTGKQFVLVMYLSAHWMYNIDTWLVVAMAVIRYTSICRNKLSQKQNVRYIVCGVVTWSLGLTVPYGLLMEVKPSSENASCFIVGPTDLATSKTPLSRVLFGIQGFVSRFVPYVLLAVFTVLLVKTVMRSIRRRSSMTSSKTITRTQTRTTAILVIIMMLQIVVEVPHAVLLFLNALDADFYSEVYTYLNHIMVLFSAASKASNIIIYYTLSRAFRATLKDKVLRCCRLKHNKNNNVVPQRQTTERTSQRKERRAQELENYIIGIVDVNEH